MQKGANGQTIMREVVIPRNPKTNAQIYQRAIMATVMKAYSAGKVIFDHSFQGYAVGEANQRRFMSENAKRLRSLLAADIARLKDGEVDGFNCCAFNGPGTNVPALALVKCSEGSYQNTIFNLIDGLPMPTEGEKVKEYAARVGLIAGDLYTICGWNVNTSDTVFSVNGVDADGAKQYAVNFVYARLQVKADLDTVETAMTYESPFSLLFDMTDSYNCTPDMTYAITRQGGEGVIESMIGATNTFRVGAVIRSRTDSDLRSTSYFEVLTYDPETSLDTAPGLTAKYILEAWKQGSERIGDSDLILEGGNQ